MGSLYLFADYSAEWPAEFIAEAARLRSLLGDQLVATHHIGSTSVPGLAAKPIIDLLPVVRSLQELDAAGAPGLEEHGYKGWGEYGLRGRRFFTKDREGYRTHNLHFYQRDDPDIERHLAFCAFLRAHEKIRDEYGALKRELYARHPSDITAYSEGKSAWIKRHEQLALRWYRPRVF